MIVACGDGLVSHRDASGCVSLKLSAISLSMVRWASLPVHTVKTKLGGGERRRHHAKRERRTGLWLFNTDFMTFSSLGVHPSYEPGPAPSSETTGNSDHWRLRASPLTPGSTGKRAIRPAFRRPFLIDSM